MNEVQHNGDMRGGLVEIFQCGWFDFFDHHIDMKHEKKQRVKD